MLVCIYSQIDHPNNPKADMQNFPNSLTTPDEIIPVVGMKATICMWSDRSPAEVTQVAKSGKTCWIKPVKWRIVSGSEQDGSAKYEYDAATADESEIKVSQTKKGWQRQGGGNILLDRQERYCDPHF